MCQRWHLCLSRQTESLPQDLLYILRTKRTVIAEIPQVDGLYSMVARSQHHANIARGKLTICQLHCALGHVSQPAILDAVKKGLIEGVELDSTSQPEFCKACTQAKSSRQPFPTETKNRARTYSE
jgi:hypothetical protein